MRSVLIIGAFVLLVPALAGADDHQSGPQPAGQQKPGAILTVKVSGVPVGLSGPEWERWHERVLANRRSAKRKIWTGIGLNVLSLTFLAMQLRGFTEQQCFAAGCVEVRYRYDTKWAAPSIVAGIVSSAVELWGRSQLLTANRQLLILESQPGAPTHGTRLQPPLGGGPIARSIATQLQSPASQR
ncbi:MAG: hypothetical protein HYX76_09860 [Acidobacteria bacterium]|nr:hypothetical protein [Acidobacteriota bacterium]